ncbi:MAG: disulfide oxidoreductase [Patescibacteria group bacterium]
MTLISAASLILSSLTVIGQVIIALIIVSIFVRETKTLEVVSKNALLFSFVVALVATLGSLFYSEVAGFEPCKLCWFQRIFMYPQVILLGIALWKKNRELAIYNSIALSFVGALIAGYHYLLQIGIAPELPCAAVGYSAACSQRFVMNFGYITIPMMALTAFSLIVVFSITAKLNAPKHRPLS